MFAQDPVAEGEVAARDCNGTRTVYGVVEGELSSFDHVEEDSVFAADELVADVSQREGLLRVREIDGVVHGGQYEERLGWLLLSLL